VGTDEERRIVVLVGNQLSVLIPAADLIAAEQNRDVSLARQRAPPVGFGPVVFEVERRRRFRPQHDLRALPDRLPCEPEVVLENRGSAHRIFTVPLLDVPLYQSDSDRFPRPRQISAAYPQRPPG